MVLKIVGTATGILASAWFVINKAKLTENGFNKVSFRFYNHSEKKNVEADQKIRDQCCGCKKEVCNLKNEVLILLHQAKEKWGCPGLSYAVSQNGRYICRGGLGLADVENGVACNSKTVMRVASISKSFTSVAIGKLYETGVIDLDAAIQKYVPDFPEKYFNGKSVSITTRQLLNHTSCVRGYFADPNKEAASPSEKILRDILLSKYGKSPVDFDENYIKKRYDSVGESLSLFESDPLICVPGSTYNYSTLAYTLVSRIIEKVTGEDFTKCMSKMFLEMGMCSTGPDLNETIVGNRARYYRRGVNRCLENVPYVDNSYKWAGGGFLSNVEDLTKFGNALLFSVQSDTGYLKSSTVKLLWDMYPITRGQVNQLYPDTGYGLGWEIQAETLSRKECVFHTGGAVGASSILLIAPDRKKDHISCKACDSNWYPNISADVPRGLVISIIVNMQSVDLKETAFRIYDLVNEH